MTLISITKFIFLFQTAVGNDKFEENMELVTIPGEMVMTSKKLRKYTKIIAFRK